MSEVDKYLAMKEKEYRIPTNTFKVIPWLETTEAIVRAFEILSKYRHRIEAAAFGADDFCTNFGIKRTSTDTELELPKKLFAMYCHAADVVGMDTPFINIKDTEGLRKELEMLKQFGFKGKFAIHPTQIEVIQKAFLPDPKEVDYSKRLVESFEKAMEGGKAAIVFEGNMVDIAAYKRGVNILKRAGLRK
eukprot:TRINITY_DN6027_c0_g3_i5.p1 TRINITY_DN6027_c0_g3~~TRINITY_DN6027_c0_g3_i5.p1  ORF type:complete len:190 (+),score=68.16 TRINITY_DN6027_c0_g3_i5:472-1041(+)